MHVTAAVLLEPAANAPRLTLLGCFAGIIFNFDEAQVALWAADMAKVLLFTVNP